MLMYCFSWNAYRRYQIRGRYNIGNQGCCAAMGDICASVCLTCALVQQDVQAKDRNLDHNQPVSGYSLQLEYGLAPTRAGNVFVGYAMLSYSGLITFAYSTWNSTRPTAGCRLAGRHRCSEPWLYVVDNSSAEYFNKWVAIWLFREDGVPVIFSFFPRASHHQRTGLE